MKFRRIFCALLAALLLCTAAAAAGYPDVSNTHWAGKQIAYLQDEIKGYPDGTFQPENTVTRGEFLTLLPALRSQMSGSSSRERTGGSLPTRSARPTSF